MKNCLMAICAVPLFFAAFAGEVKVTAVTAQQRYPWNGLVDITVTIQGTADDIAEAEWSFAATNSATKVAIPVDHITQNGADVGSGSIWTRKFIWDAKADVGAVKIEDVALMVDAKKDLGGVQLWENGPYWAECNVGAEKPEDYGCYFWWGDTVGYKRNATNNGWVSVKDGSAFSFSTDNCPTDGKSNSVLQSLGYIDASGSLVAEHDAATAHLGAPWRMPTDAEFSALLNNCNTTWTTRNGVPGRLITGRGAYSSKSIFLPAAGNGRASYLYRLGSYGYYWSSTPRSFYDAWDLCFYSSDFYRDDYRNRDGGQSVRPVRGFAGVVSSGTVNVGGNRVSSHLSLDCREVRGAAATEIVHYSSGWVTADQLAVVEIAVNGEVAKRASGAGMFEWLPAKDGVYDLTHIVKVNGAQVGEVLTARFVVGNAPLIDANGVLIGYNGEVPEELVIPDGVASIANGTFRDCKTLKSLTIPSSVEFIGGDAFEGCVNLDTIRVDAGDIDRVRNLIKASGCNVAKLTFIDTNGVTLEPFSIKRIEARQRYPWNGLVDVTVTLQGTVDDIAEAEWSFAATNSATKAAISVDHITQDGADVDSGSTWTRKFIWDAKADVGAVRIEDVALTVDAKVTGCVQLWENGPYWAKCNVGATKPEEYGYYFWWGDTVGYKRNAANNGWVSVKDGSSFSFGNCPTSGKDNASLQSLGYIDATGNLAAAHDAATAHLGTSWRMPTDAEFSALLNNCNTTWTTRNGVPGRLITGRGAYSSKSIFLPAAGSGYDSDLDDLGSTGSYWSSTPDLYTSYYAWALCFYSSDFHRDDYRDRDGGQSVRPVRGFAGVVSSGTVNVGGNRVSSHLSLDCREVRGAAATEIVHYSSGWVTADQLAVVEIAVNGEVAKRASGAGMFEWLPAKDGVYDLTHIVKVNGAQVGEVLTARFVVGNAPLIDANGVLIGYNGEVPEELVIPDGVTSIASGAFADCQTLKSVTIPSIVAEIGDDAFKGCSSLTQVRYDAKVAEPGFYEAVFTGISSYSEDNDIVASASGIKLQAEKMTANNLDEYTMYGYAAYMWFEGGVTYEFEAGYDDRSSIKIDGGYLIQASSSDCVTQSATKCFDESGWHWIELRGWNCGGPGACNYGDQPGVHWRKQGETAWRLFKDEGDGALFRLKIGLISIANLFADSPIAQIELGRTVDTISADAFADLTTLTALTIPSSVTTIGNNAFKGCANLATIRVDAGDIDRVRNLVKASGFDVSGLTFIDAAGVTLEPFSIKRLEARQRYPWNGLVDITVTLQGAEDEVSQYECEFAATNSETDESVPVTLISQNGADTHEDYVWTRKFVWDAKSDVGAVKIEEIELSVGTKVSGGVQLWENGPYWAECNVGAEKPEEYGYYFWWGDTVGYKRNASNNGWVSSKDGTSHSLSTGNCPTYGKNDSQLLAAGYIDATGNLVASYDAARAHLGAPWRMPTDDEHRALISNCTTRWTTRNGVYGRLVSGKGNYADKSIFMPATGLGENTSYSYSGEYGHYWSASAHPTGSSTPQCLRLYSGNFHCTNCSYWQALSVRPVRNVRSVVVANDVTTRLSLDCREGLKDLLPEGSKLRYDASWYAGADSIRILCNGSVLTSGVWGEFAWNPDPNRSVYQLELQAIKNDEIVASESAAMGVGYIRNVSARQLWPHNKVEISYVVADDIGEIVDADAELVVSCDAVNTSARTLIGDTSAKPGLHRVVWDLEADGVSINKPDVQFSVGYDSEMEVTPVVARGGWSTRVATPSTWTPSSGNVLRGITPSFSGTRYGETGRVSSSASLSLLTDGAVNVKGDTYANTIGITSGTLTWELPSSVDLKSLRINTHWGDGGRDGIALNSIQVQKSGTTTWVDLEGSAITYGIDNNSSSDGDLEFVFAGSVNTVLATDVTAIRFNLGTQDNKGSGFTEFEAIGVASAGVSSQDALVHRWSFNGDLTDSVGGQTATAVGNVTTDGSQYRLAGGSNGSSYISLGSNILPVDAGATTIEIWATRNQIRNWARILDIGSSTANYLIWAWNNSTYDYDNVDYNNNVNTKTGVIDNNREYCFVVRIEDQDSGHGLATWSKYDAQTGCLIDDVVSFQMSSLPLSKIGQTSCYLGHSRWSSDYDASASYNEVRVWNYALSDAEIAEHLKLGPDTMPSLAIADATSGVSEPIEVSTLASSGTPLDASVSAELGFSPIDTGLATVIVDGELLLSSTNSGSFVWQPKTIGEHTLEHLAGTNHWTRTVNVTSLMFAEPPTPNPPTAADTNIKLGATSRSVVAAGGTVSITTSGSGTWNATTSADWITFNGASSKAAGQSCIVRVAANTDVESRVGYVYVSGHIYTITQAGVGAELEAYSAEFGPEGGEGEVLVLADGQLSWKVKPESEWISVRETSGTGEAYVHFNVAPFAGVSDRTGYLTIAGRTYEVHQIGRELSISRLKDDFDYQSHAVEIDVTAFSSTEWYVTPFGSWISVVAPVEGLSHGSGKVMLAVNENPSYLPRSGSVMIGTERYDVTQAGRPPEALAFAISPERATASVNGANGLIAVSATPDLPWTVESQANWLTVMPTFREEFGDGNVVYTATPNSTMSERTGTIVVSAIAASEQGSRTHTVVQPAAVAAIAAEDHDFAAAGDSFDLEVMVGDNVNWTISGAPGVSALPDWVKVDGELNRIGPGVVKIAVTDNQNVDRRTATITVAGEAFTLIQQGRTVEVEYLSRVFDTEGGDGTIEVHPNGTVHWTAVSSETWLTIWAEDGASDNPDGSVSGSSDGTIGYYVDPYIGDGESLTGTITIGDKVVYITQRAYAASISPSAATVGGNAGVGEFGFSASIDDVWTALDILCSKDWITTAQVTSFNATTKSGTIRYTYAANDSGVPRTGMIVVAGEAYQLTQSERQVARIEVEIEGEGGEVSGGGVYDVGAVVALTATPADGFEFTGWYKNGSQVTTSVRYSFTASVNAKYIAKFEAIPTYLINGEIVRRGTVVSCAAPADRIDDAGTTKLVCRGTSAYPDKGASFTLVASEDVAFEWDLWTTNYLVTADGVASWCVAGSVKTLTPKVPGGQTFFRWTGDVARAEAGDNPLRLIVDGPKTVTSVSGVFTDSLNEALDATDLVFRTGGDGVWHGAVDALAPTGYTAASVTAAPESDVWLETTLEGAGTLVFDWRTDCEHDDSGACEWDRLAVFVNGVEKARIDGVADYQHVALPITGEKSVIRWSFYRDEYDESGSPTTPRAWVDGIRWTK